MKACRQINHQPVVVGSPISAEISIRSDAILIHVSRDPLRRSRDCRNRPVLRIEAFQPFFFALHSKILGPERCKTEFIFDLESFFFSGCDMLFGSSIFKSGWTTVWSWKKKRKSGRSCGGQRAHPGTKKKSLLRTSYMWPIALTRFQSVFYGNRLTCTETG